MSFTLSPPEQHLAPSPTTHVPNSRLPVLVYRSAISSPTPASIQAAIEPNNWLKGGTWKHFPNAHFHSVTHELYVVFSGSSQLLLGRGKLDPPTDEDLILDVKVGDALVVPAGVAHCSLKSSDDYEYMGLYPKVSSPVKACFGFGSTLIVWNREVRTGTTTTPKLVSRKQKKRLRLWRLFRFQNGIPCLVPADRLLKFGGKL